MSLAADLRSARALDNPGRCGVCEWYAELDVDDRAEFDQWIADGDSISELWRLCRGNGLTLQRPRFAEHVRDHHVAS